MPSTGSPTQDRVKTPYDDENSIVSGAESLVAIASKKVKEDVAALTKAVVGRSGRGFQQVDLSPEERAERYRALRDADDPIAWQTILDEAQTPRARASTLKWMAEQEAAWRAAQAAQG